MADYITKKRIQKSLRFSDFDIAFRRHPVTGKLIIKKNEDSIKQAIKYLVLMSTGERFFNPFLGTNLRRKLFENTATSLESDIQYIIETNIKNFEPRVTFEGVEDFLDPFGVTVRVEPDQNLLVVRIKYMCINSLVVDAVEINLDRIR